MMQVHCQKNLQQLRSLLQRMSTEQYNNKVNILSGATIGQHIRHILEFYQCVLDHPEDVVNYDIRERNRLLETDVEYTIITIDGLLSKLEVHTEDHYVVFEGNFSVTNDVTLTMATSLYRELAYCLEHGIHHQALIKIGLTELNLSSHIDSSFGVAATTLRFKNNQQN